MFRIRAEWAEHIPEWAVEALRQHVPGRSLSYPMSQTPPDVGLAGWRASSKRFDDRRQYRTREAATAAMPACQRRKQGIPRCAVWTIQEHPCPMTSPAATSPSPTPPPTPPSPPPTS